MLSVSLLQAAEAVGEDLVDDGDGEEQRERDGEHDEDCEQREEEEHGICCAEGLHPLNQHWWFPLATPSVIAGARTPNTQALRTQALD